MINNNRLISEFCELVSIDSVSFNERKMADTLKKKLTELGIEVLEDQAGEKYNGNAGNIYGYLKGNLPGTPILFSAHMDTVEPGIGKRAKIREDGKIVSSGTVLGADDVSGIAAILEALIVIKKNSLPHRDIELLFSIAEEVYCKGSKVFDYTQIKSREAYILDLSGEVGTAALQAPTLISFVVQIQGKASHAGFAPEDGVNAIAIASEAITGIKQGRIDEDTTVNIGCITGGTATNIVSERVVMKGEIRSYSHNKAMELATEIKERFVTTAERYHGNSNFEYSIELEAYHVEESEAVVQRSLKICDKLGYKTRLTKTFGGSDNNNFAKHGIHGIVLACGMNQVHSIEEYSNTDELIKSSNIILNLMTSED